MDTKKLLRICPLTRDEIIELEKKKQEYKDIIEELENEYENYIENLKEKSFLQGKLASINYNSYEEFMRIHANAIKISAIVADLEISGLLRRDDLDRRTKELLDRYLLLKQLK
jgi:urocanate hydratase